MINDAYPTGLAPEKRGGPIAGDSADSEPRRCAVAAFMRLFRRCFAGRLSGFLAVAAACLLVSGCGSPGGMRPLAVPFGLGAGKDSFTEAVQKDPFPDAAQVNLDG